MKNSFYNKKFFISLIILIITIFTTSFLYRDISRSVYFQWIDHYWYILMFTTVLIILMMRMLEFRWMSFSGWFLILLFVFHFGHVFLTEINYEFVRSYNMISAYRGENMQVTLLISFLFFLGTVLGVILGLRSSSDNSVKTVKYNKFVTREIAWVYLLVTSPFYFYYQINILSSVASGNYMNSFNTFETGIIGDIAFLFYYALILLICSYFEDDRKFWAAVSVSFSILMISMASGGRGQQMLCILLIGLIILKKIKFNFSFLKIVGIAIIFYLIMGILNTIGDLRLLENINLQLFVDMFVQKLTQNPIVEIVEELGGTIQTPFRIYQQVPTQTPYGYGKTFILSFVTIIPNIASILDIWLDDINFMRHITGVALGGSYIGELYYNFSLFGFFVSIIFGNVIQALSKKMEQSLDNKNYIHFIMYVPIFVFGLWWVRGNFSGIIRTMVWNAISIFMIKTFILQLRASLGKISTISK
ncbi:hypothetical protein NUITMVRA1_16390 [Aerococcus viridans]|uniref:O-antigen polysaccharide polymerase Wzy n=1 Tax=Aerococcus viridans TaxID=1377 RepID=UPI0028FDC289|nr:hypothetical protein NUITMVRA1_16390 [Aerococcus viridans]